MRAVRIRIGHVALGPEALQDLDAVEAGEAQVEDDQVRDELLGQRQGLDPVAGALDLVALGPQGAAQDVGDRLVVLDHEDARARGCRFSHA